MTDMAGSTPVETRDTLQGLGAKLHPLFGIVGLGAIAGGLALELAVGGGFRGFLFRYLVAIVLPLTISLGALFFVLVQHLTKAGWSAGLRRVAEILSLGLFPVMLLFVPVLLSVLIGSDALYAWNNPETVAKDHLLQGKAGYLSPMFFAVRMVLYFAIWGGLARFFFKTSQQQDLLGSASLTSKMEAVSAPGMLAFALSASFAGFDWLMSLDPLWYSTIFGIYFFAGCLVGFYATMILSVIYLQSRGALKLAPTVEHYHDLGKLLFAFTCFWAYIAFSQYFLIWYANIPEETGWFLRRRTPAWMWVSYLLAAGHFALPFVVMMSRHMKRSKGILVLFASWMLLMHWFDLYWQILPEYTTRAGISVFPFSLTDLLLVVGALSTWLAGISYLGGQANLMAVADPRLPESLAFKNV